MKVWQNFLMKQEEVFGKDVVDKYMRSLRVVNFNARNIYLAGNSFCIQWFKEHVLSTCKIVNNNGFQVNVHLVKSNEKSAKEKRQFSKKDVFIRDNVDSKASLSTFIFGNDNELASKVVDDILNNFSHRCSFNPVYFFGQRGSGKSHLLQSIVNECVERNLKPYYTTGKTFVKNVIIAYKNKSLQAFRSFYEIADIAIVDGIDDFSGKLGIQEELFYLFNKFFHEEKQIIFSGLSLPKDFVGFKDRLTSRICGGISISLKELSKVELKDLIIAKAKQWGYSLDFAVENFLLSMSSVREMVGKLELLLFNTDLENHKCYQGKKLSMTNVRKCFPNLENVSEGAVQKKILLSHEKIIKATSISMKISIEDILSDGRRRDFSLARKLAIFLCYNKLNLSLSHLGCIFRRNHSTIIASIRSINDKMQSDCNVKEALKAIENRLYCVEVE